LSKVAFALITSRAAAVVSSVAAQTSFQKGNNFMIQIEFIEGTPGANAAMTLWANNAVRRFNFFKRGRRLSQPELHAVRVATIRETPAEEVERRIQKINQILGR
jgi:hypothetical protein